MGRLVRVAVDKVQTDCNYWLWLHDNSASQARDNRVRVEAQRTVTIKLYVVLLICHQSRVPITLYLAHYLHIPTHAVICWQLLHCWHLTWDAYPLCGWLLSGGIGTGHYVKKVSHDTWYHPILASIAQYPISQHQYCSNPTYDGLNMLKIWAFNTMKQY